MPRIRVLDDNPFGDSVDRPLPPTPISYEDFLDWCDEDTLAEWVDGEIVLMSPATPRHQDVGGLLYLVLRCFVDASGLGRVFYAPLQMRLGSIRRGREPDIVFVAQEHLHRIGQTYLDGPADLVVEVTSPESIFRDREEKLREYAAAGIPEYWLIDLVAGRAIFYELEAPGAYRITFEGREGEYPSRVLPGLRLPLAWLWQDPPPTILDVQRHLGLLG